jgi:hypothetical protein
MRTRITIEQDGYDDECLMASIETNRGSYNIEEFINVFIRPICSVAGFSELTISEFFDPELPQLTTEDCGGSPLVE